MGWGARTEDADAVFADRAIEVDRTFVSLDTDSGEIVGTTSAYSLTMSMPGGALVPVAGVYLVGVEPTHRRRGVMSSMMRHQLKGLANGGEAVAALWTTDPAIYQRFGYGLATWRSRIELDLARAMFSPRADALASASCARLRQMSVADALPHLAAVHEEIVGSRPGVLARSESRWNFLMRLEDGEPEVVVAMGPEGPVGYVAYRIRPGQSCASPGGEVEVQEISAVDPATHAQLWRYLLGLDLMRTVSAHRPLPDPLVHLLVDLRHLHATIDDALWVRLVDLPRAFGQRAFAAPIDLVLEVTDAVLPANAGRWRVSVDAAGEPAAARPTRGDADLSLDISDLGAAHLGATHLADLALAGRVHEHTPGALAAASLAWSWSPIATCPEIF
ncbi:GNAT family N-acetyltransferase [Humibacillus sp. DSM 29435]|uniref:GNAT family N-acetyltransferase n=1 Tax=Humibacillus sp. DSM 29435 TaxID=1869167 RepID=UPI0021131216|nr:GNAT family N-acetyltransferase [Humibacillus sp. DSM 29435]